MINGLSHTGLVVRDIEKQIVFYRDIIGLEVVREKNTIAPITGDHTAIPNARRRLVFLGKANSEHKLELVYYSDPQSPEGQPNDRHQVNAIHICFDVEDSEQLYKELLSKGVKFLTPPKLIKGTEGSGASICYAQDPEGNWLEFIEKNEDE